MSATARVGLIGSRIKALRERRKLSQVDLASLFGLNDRQTVSAIETGVRRISAEELLCAVEKLEEPLEYFTDPFRLVGEGRFSWRHNGVGQDALEEYERQAGSWIATFRCLASQVGREPQLFRRSLRLTSHSNLEDAAEAGERVVKALRLGPRPAARLQRVMEEDLGILVLVVDPLTSNGISAAACRLPELDAVLISRKEVAGCRHFDLGHELFHLLTWDAMPPQYSEDLRATDQKKGKRVEQLANSFASALLMPRHCLKPLDEWNRLSTDELIARLNATADRLSVTSAALSKRLTGLGKLQRATVRSLPKDALRHNGRDEPESERLALFSRPFAEVTSLAVQRECVSIRRIARLLGFSVEGLSEWFAEHQVDDPVNI